MKILTVILLLFYIGASAQGPGITNVVVAVKKTEFRGYSDSKMMLTVGYESVNNGSLTPITKCPLIEKWNSNKTHENEFLLQCQDGECLDSLRNNLGYLEISLLPSLKSDLALQCEIRVSYIDDKTGEKTVSRMCEIKLPRGSPSFKVNWNFYENTTGE